jgi:hypothetical protein
MTTKPKNQSRPPSGGRYQSQILNSSAKLNAMPRAGETLALLVLNARIFA